MKNFRKMGLILSSLIFILTIFAGCGDEALDPSTAATPEFSITGGTYTGAQLITITTTTADATIYYTINGDDPITLGTTYTGAISIASNMTIKAVAKKSGWEDSAIAREVYAIDNITATPVFSPEGGICLGNQLVTITSTTSGATVYYTTNGADPITLGIPYTEAISVTTHMTIKSVAKKSGWGDSAVTSSTYTITYTQETDFTFSNGTITAYSGSGGYVAIPTTIAGVPVTAIGDGAFASCASLTGLFIPDSVTNIGGNAFFGCTSLPNVIIPNSVTNIKTYAFGNCTSLTNVTLLSVVPPTLGGTSVFDNNASGRDIFVPSASVAAYKVATYWNEYAANIQAIIP